MAGVGRLRRALSAIALLVAVTALSAPVAAGAVPSADDAGQLSDRGSDGLQRLAECLQSNPHLAALLVVDESKSLKKTDPDAKRAAVLSGVIESLSTLAGRESETGSRKVATSLMYFGLGADQQPTYPWTFLDPATADDLVAQVEADVPTRNEGGATDYQAALLAARGQLAASQDLFPQGEGVCKALFFFTDGGMNVDNDEQATGAAIEAMCAPGGLLDGLRSDQDTFIAVRLLEPGAVGNKKEEATRQLLQTMAETVDASDTLQCGSELGRPAASGAYLEGSVDALAALFGTALGVGAGGTLVPNLSGSPVTFVIDPGIASFQLVAQAPEGFTLAAPGQSPIDVQPGQTDVSIGGQSATVRWADTAFTLVTAVGPDGTGSWTLTRPGRDDAVSLVLFSGLEIRLDDAKLVVGEESPITGQIVTRAGQVTDLSVYTEKTLTLEQRSGTSSSPAQPLTLQDDGSFQGSFTPAEGSTQVVFTITLGLKTQSGQQLSNLVRTFTQPVRLSDIYPNVEPAAIDFGALEHGGNSSEVPLTLVGSAKGATKVCFGTPSITSGLTDVVTLSGPGACEDLAQDETRQVTFTLTLDESVADGGNVSGEIPITVTSAASGESGSKEKSLNLPFTGQVVPVAPIAWIPPLLVALGLLIPLIFLWVVNWLASRMALDGLYRASVPVEVIDDGSSVRFSRVSPAQDGTTALLTHHDFSPMDSSLGRERRWGAPDGEVLGGRAPINPFGAVTAFVRSGPGRRVVSNRNPMVTSSGDRAGLDIRPQGNVYLLMEESSLGSSPMRGTLVAYIKPGVMDLRQQAADLGAEVAVFPGWADGLRSLASTAEATTGTAEPAAPSGAGAAGQQEESIFDRTPSSGSPTGPSAFSASSPEAEPTFGDSPSPSAGASTESNDSPDDDSGTFTYKFD